jgi:hypothetical protein
VSAVEANVFRGGLAKAPRVAEILGGLGQDAACDEDGIDFLAIGSRSVLPGSGQRSHCG